MQHYLVKRLHDLNLSGWWYWLNIILSLILLFNPSTKGSNKFGVQPTKASKLEYFLVFIFIPMDILAIIFFGIIKQELNGL